MGGWRIPEKGALLALIAIALVGGAWPATAQADEVPVNSCTDPVLRQAIADASPGDTIRFNCDGDIQVFPGDGAYLVTKELTFDATGRDVAINGTSRTRLFVLTGTGTITMRGLTLKGGRSADGFGGGGILVFSGTLVADRVRFLGNSATDGGGGAISVGQNVRGTATGALTVTNSEFLGNSSFCDASCAAQEYGGGAIRVFAGGPTRIERSSFRGNFASGFGSGGAVLGQFTRNPSFTGPITIVDSVFEGNAVSTTDVDATRPVTGGGAAAVFNHDLTVERSRFTDNVATPFLNGFTHGGAVVVAAVGGEPDTEAPATIVDSVFSQNTVRGITGSGGAVQANVSPVEIVRTVMEGNEAEEGGAVAGFGPTTITDSRLVGNTARGSLGRTGGGVWAGGQTTVEGTDVVENAPDGCFTQAPGEIVDAGDNFEFPGASCGFAAIVRPSLSVGDLQVPEPDPGELAAAQFSLTLSRPLTHPLQVDYQTVDGTAIAGQDYEPVAGRLEIPAGETSAGVRVDVLGDDAAEGDETFSLQLSLPEPGRTELAGTGAGTATIVDGDTPAPIPDTPVPIPGDTAAPLISKFFARPAKLPRGDKLSLIFRLSEPAAATLRFERLLPGRKVDGDCVAPKDANLDERKCRRSKGAGGLEREGEAGMNVVTVRRVDGESLRSGRYRVTLLARDGAGNVSEPDKARFKVLPEPDELGG